MFVAVALNNKILKLQVCEAWRTDHKELRIPIVALYSGQATS